jgi:hypothetical protein
MWLADGHAMMTEEGRYRQHIAMAVEEREVRQHSFVWAVLTKCRNELAAHIELCLTKIWIMVGLIIQV